MKKKVCIVLASLMIISYSTACAFNMSFFDTTWNFARAVISMPDGTVVEGEVQSWNDFRDSDCVQVTIDGKTYLTHYSRVVLISE